MAFADKPVWTIRPNWKEGVLERLEWLTDVLVSDTGVEQRRSVRLTPRRSFEITVHPTDTDRAYLDLLLHRLGSKSWLFPLWHDQAVLDMAADIGSSALSFDNTFREFQDGGQALLYFDARTWEVVDITSQTDDGIALDAETEQRWPKGTKVYPLRSAVLRSDTSLSALTSRVGQSVLLFELEGENEWPDGIGDEMVMYQGSPLLTREPNRSREITTDHVRLTEEMDAETGRRYRVDSAGRAFYVQSHNWMVQGREAQAGFRSFLYALAGRQKRVFLPTFNDDLVLAAPANATQAFVRIQDNGLALVNGGSPIPGRAVWWTGKEVVRHVDFLAPGGPGEAKPALQSPLAHSYPEGASWSFLAPARLDQDSIELHHHTDSDGTMECAAGFHTYLDARDASGSNFNPIPLAAKTSGTCGSLIGSNPCAHLDRDCGDITTIFLQVYDPCRFSAPPADFSIDVPHPMMIAVPLWSNGQPLSGQYVVAGPNQYGIPTGTVLCQWGGGVLTTQVPLFLYTRSGVRFTWYAYGTWPSGMCPDFIPGGGPLRPEKAYIMGGVPRPSDCKILPLPVLDIRYIGYAAHDWTWEFNQYLDERDYFP